MKKQLVDLAELVKHLGNECCSLLESLTDDIDLIVKKMTEQNRRIEALMSQVESENEYDYVIALIRSIFEREKIALIPYRNSYYQLQKSLSKARKLEYYQDGNE